MNFKPVTFFTDKTPSKPRAVIASKKDGINVGDEVLLHEDFLANTGTVKSIKNKGGDRLIIVEFADGQTVTVLDHYLVTPEQIEGGRKSDIKTAAEEPKKEDAPKQKDFDVSFDGDITVKDSKGNVVLKLNAADISPEDIDKLKASDIQSLAEKFTKIKELGLTIENTNIGSFGEETPADLGAPETLEDLGAEPKKDEEKKELSPWAARKSKRTVANVPSDEDKINQFISEVMNSSGLLDRIMDVIARYNDNYREDVPFSKMLEAVENYPAKTAYEQALKALMVGIVKGEYAGKSAEAKVKKTLATSDLPSWAASTLKKIEAKVEGK